MSASNPRYADEVKAFGPPFAYYKDKKHGPSVKLFLAGVLLTLVCILDFLLATNILIYVRTMNPDSTREIFIHTLVILLSLMAIWLLYRLLVWYVMKYQINDHIKGNKLYQRIRNDAIELENLLDHPSKRGD